MSTLDRAAILKHTKLATERVAVPEWGGDVYVRELTGAERDQWEASILDANGKPTNTRNARARLAVLTVVDGEGNRLFADEDAEELGATSARPLARVFNVACRLAGITENDLAELEGNSDAARRGGSGSD